MSSTDTSQTNVKLLCTAVAASVATWMFFRYSVKDNSSTKQEAKQPSRSSDDDKKTPDKKQPAKKKEFDLASLLRREEITYGK